ncbi:MAG: NTP transferase domain-containing protein [Candidatus Pacebacteria bacterium]|nr:NTP transferase domain-containing protein [Candidatus Paceibacterota bacterium]
MIRKAVIAAAGNGTRFLPVTKIYPKELLPVLNKPILHYLVEELLGAGIDQICLIHRPDNDSIQRYFLPDKSFKAVLRKAGKLAWIAELEKIQAAKIKWTFIPQSRKVQYGSGTPVLLAKGFVKKNPFVYFYGDDLVLERKSGSFLSSLIKIFERYQADEVMAVQEVPWDQVNRYGSVRYRQNSRIPYQIETIEEGLPAGRAPSNMVQFGRFVLSPGVIPVLEKQFPRRAAASSTKKELLFTDTGKILAKEGVVIAWPIKKGKWLTTGDPERWLQTNLEFQKFFS